MDIRGVQQNWVGAFRKLLGEAPPDFGQISQILHRSKRFLQLASLGGASSTYSSYVEQLRESVEQTFDQLVAHRDQPATHLGIYEIIDNYRLLPFSPRVAEVIQHYLVAAPTAQLIWSVSKLVEKFDLSQRAAAILARSVVLAKDPEYLVGEGAIRVVLALYLKPTGQRAEYLKELSLLFKTKYLELYLSRVYPAIVKHEPAEVAVQLVQLLLKAGTVPIFTVAQHLSATALSLLPAPVLASLRARLETEQFKAEIVAGLATLAKLPPQFTLPELLALFLRTDPAVGVLYEQSSFLVSQLEQHPTWLESVAPPLGVSAMAALGAADGAAFFERLRQGTDGTRIQLCRLLYHCPVAAQQATLLALLPSKNIRVKWNALRALTRYQLPLEDIQALLGIYQRSAYDKIKLWVLKVVEANAPALPASALPTSLQLLVANSVIPPESPYHEDIEQVLNKLRQVFFFNGSSR